MLNRKQVQLALAHIKLWPAAYLMGGHDTHVCRIITKALEELLEDKKADKIFGE